MQLLLPLFIVLPILEMFILIQVGGIIGAVPTIALVLSTAIVGLHLLRQQGLSTLMRANQKLATGEMPAEEVVEGLMLAVGGALLLTPGFVTDAIGFCCLVPQSRRFLAKKLMAKGILKATQSSAFNANTMNSGSFEFHQSEFTAQSGFDFQQGDIIDGESTPVNDEQLLK